MADTYSALLHLSLARLAVVISDLVESLVKFVLKEDTSTLHEIVQECDEDFGEVANQDKHKDEGERPELGSLFGFDDLEVHHDQKGKETNDRAKERIGEVAVDVARIKTFVGLYAGSEEKLQIVERATEETTDKGEEKEQHDGLSTELARNGGTHAKNHIFIVCKGSQDVVHRESE